ncbi:uncharacterized protein UV8b_06242 [Ustilaginoidea virens]|uniref:Nuclear membrane fusion protein Kar5 n=1 Tax=Ustilaginoidea virens TaxID=1159556 RepID=A0A8E5HUX8_USTVR|nr:uncharacterized protein UV8b_06242 [Ustilaginoidea virens]QUC22001.1 hypothetical protein UV8b_06242 [Ustilaginoidea virens]
MKGFATASLGAVLFFSHPLEALRWPNARPLPVNGLADGESPLSTASLHLRPSNSNVYATALVELQELELEPLCHRVAARLLVTNCQLLDGRNDATVMTDTGRAARDFVDSFAASLAICDLERASFPIPASCSKFREGVLATLPAPLKPQLHVMTSEIDSCLEGLARSDSAWSTWVSYRHKALRFCEASRADNEKDQHIRLHKKLAQILERLTSQAETESRARAEHFDSLLRQSAEKAQSLTQQTDRLAERVSQVDQLVSNMLQSKSKETELALHDGMQGVRSLQRLMQRAFHEMAVREKTIAAIYASSLDEVKAQAVGDAKAVMQVFQGLAASATVLQTQLAKHEDQMHSVSRRQEQVLQTMGKLSNLADRITEKQRSHELLMESTQNRTFEILGSLETATSSVSALQMPLVQLGWTSWVPYIVCPTASLVLGSYGLPPSMTRNLLLLSIGEAAGYYVASMKTHKSETWTTCMPAGRFAEGRQSAKRNED